MSELFPIEQISMDSPKLAWMKKHAVRIIRCDLAIEEDPWCAWFPENESVDFAECPYVPYQPVALPLNPDACGYGQTEEEALRDLAVKYRVTLWNEEP